MNDKMTHGHPAPFIDGALRIEQLRALPRTFIFFNFHSSLPSFGSRVGGTATMKSDDMCISAIGVGYTYSTHSVMLLVLLDEMEDTGGRWVMTLWEDGNDTLLTLLYYCCQQITL